VQIFKKNKPNKIHKPFKLLHEYLKAGINPLAWRVEPSRCIMFALLIFRRWRVGYNIEYTKGRCYVGFRSSEHYGESYYCLCSDKEIPPISK